VRRVAFTSTTTLVALIVAFGATLAISLSTSPHGQETLADLAGTPAQAAPGHDDPDHDNPDHDEEGHEGAVTGSDDHEDPFDVEMGHTHPLDTHGEGADDTHAAHGDHGDDHGGVPHLPSFIDVITGAMAGPDGELSGAGQTIQQFKSTIFVILIAILLAIVSQAATRNMTLVPGKLQNVFEAIFGGLADFIEGILGSEHARTFIPFLGTLFIFIWVMNLGGLLPFWFAPTSTLEMTVSLAIPVFLFVQFSAFRLQGPGGYLFHLAGEPRDVIGWIMVPLILPLHIIGELAKPVSLSLRLFGNVFGEETVVAVFVMLGVAVLAFLPDAIPLGLPLHVPFMFLGLLTGTIQALVFMLLSTIYFALILPHGHDEH
jgi:F-type H+-transporting ATPase subunit a